MKTQLIRNSVITLVSGSLLTFVIAIFIFGGSSFAADKSNKSDLGYGVERPPQWNSKGELIQPKNFRQWVFIGSPLTPNALNNGSANFPEYHNVYVQPSAFKHYRKTKTWPEGTMMVKELQLLHKGDFEDGSKFEPSGRGFFPAVVNGLDVSVKDSKRFADSNNWGYFNFGHHAPPYASTAPAAPMASCASCHIANADEDMVFMKFYRSIIDPLPVK